MAAMVGGAVMATVMGDPAGKPHVCGWLVMVKARISNDDG